DSGELAVIDHQGTVDAAPHEELRELAHGRGRPYGESGRSHDVGDPMLVEREQREVDRVRAQPHAMAADVEEVSWRRRPVRAATSFKLVPRVLPALILLKSADRLVGSKAHHVRGR